MWLVERWKVNSTSLFEVLFWETAVLIHVSGNSGFLCPVGSKSNQEVLCRMCCEEFYRGALLLLAMGRLLQDHGSALLLSKSSSLLLSEWFIQEPRSKDSKFDNELSVGDYIWDLNLNFKDRKKLFFEKLKTLSNVRREYEKRLAQTKWILSK